MSSSTSLKVLIASALLAVAASAVSARTILSVTEGPPGSGAGIGIFPAQAVAIEFTVGRSYSNVSIAPDISGSLSFAGVAYLTTQIGTGATAAQEVASQPFTFSGSYFPVIFQNVSIASGTYYLVLSASTANPPQALLLASSPTIVADVGTSTPFGVWYGVPASNPTYAPSFSFLFSTEQFGGTSHTPQFVISGDAAPVPEPQSLAMFLSGIGLIVSVASYRKRLT